MAPKSRLMNLWWSSHWTYTGNRQTRSFFKEMSIFSCVEAFPGSRAFLQNASKLWWSQRNHVFTCFCVFSCVQLGFRYLVMLRVYVVFVAFSWGETCFCGSCFLISDFCTFNCIQQLLLNCCSIAGCCSVAAAGYCQTAAGLLLNYYLPLGLHVPSDLKSYHTCVRAVFRLDFDSSFLYLTGCWFEYCFIAVGSVLLTWFYLYNPVWYWLQSLSWCHCQ